MISVYLIRHAESEGNVNHHLIGGQSNHLPLTERGREQARRLGQRLQREGYRFDAWWSSTAVRAIDTAALAAHQMPDLDLPHQRTPVLLEVGQGEWEGQVRKEIYTEATWAQFRADPLHFKAPGGESFGEVQQRMRRWLDQAHATYASTEADVHIAAFSHGMAIRCLLVQLLDAPAQMARRMVTDNTSITCLEHDHKGWRIERLNDAAHLTGMEKIAHY